MKLKVIIILALTISFLLITPIFAVDMESSKYRIQFGNVNIGAERQTSTSYNMTTTLGQTAANEFNSNGYVVKAGFQYIHSIIPFSFSVSKTNIDFGKLIPGTPSTDDIDLTVTFGAAGQYQVTVSQDDSFRTYNNAYSIPDTICDPSYTCTESVANKWSSNSTYGWGYRMTGNDIAQSFITCEASHGQNCYRSFPNRAQSEPPSVVMESTNVTSVSLTPTGTPSPTPINQPRNSHRSTMRLKVNIDGLQTAGSYYTVLQFVATPTY